MLKVKRKVKRKRRRRRLPIRSTAACSVPPSVPTRKPGTSGGIPILWARDFCREPRFAVWRRDPAWMPASSAGRSTESSWPFGGRAGMPSSGYRTPVFICEKCPHPMHRKDAGFTRDFMEHSGGRLKTVSRKPYWTFWKKSEPKDIHKEGWITTRHPPKFI